VLVRVLPDFGPRSAYRWLIMAMFVAVFALVLAYLALVTGYLALRTLARLRAATAVLAKASTDAPDGPGGPRRKRWRNLVEITEEQIRTTAAVAAELDEVRTELVAHRGTLDAAVQAGRQQIAADLHQSNARLDTYRDEIDVALAHALRNVALVRYDAFDDMAGRMSFSVAMLDDNGDGLALSSIAGRSDTRIYAKGVQGGRSEYDLSPEEDQAITAAIRNRSERVASERAATRRRQDRRAS
jgi:Protein of unknown function (DUF4446)